MGTPGTGRRNGIPEPVTVIHTMDIDITIGHLPRILHSYSLSPPIILYNTLSQNAAVYHSQQHDYHHEFLINVRHFQQFTLYLKLLLALALCLLRHSVRRKAGTDGLYATIAVPTFMNFAHIVGSL